MPISFAALIFSRSDDTQWQVEKVFQPPSFAWPIRDGTEQGIFTGGGVRRVNLFAYDVR